MKSKEICDKNWTLRMIESMNIIKNETRNALTVHHNVSWFYLTWTEKTQKTSSHVISVEVNYSSEKRKSWNITPEFTKQNLHLTSSKKFRLNLHGEVSFRTINWKRQNKCSEPLIRFKIQWTKMLPTDENRLHDLKTLSSKCEERCLEW